MNSIHRIAIIGAGRVGSAIGYLAQEKGYKITGVCCAHFPNAKSAARLLSNPALAYEGTGEWLKGSDLVLITTPDAIIEEVCRETAREGYLSPGAIVAHCSGALSSSILDPAKVLGCNTGSIHPLQSCPTREQAIKVLPDSYFCIEGDEGAKAGLKALALAIGGRIIGIETGDKPLYHTGAAVASNYLVALLNFAITLYEKIGIDRKNALNALAPLFKGTIENIQAIGIPDALTGPIARGDVETIRIHLIAIKEAIPGYLPLYIALGEETIRVAIAKGSITPETGQKISALFKEVWKKAGVSPIVH